MAWSVLQSASAAYAGGTTSNPSATFPGNVIAGSKLFCFAALLGPLSAINSVKDGAGNSFTLQSDFTGTPDNTFTLALYTLDTPAGDAGTAPVITVALTGANNSAVMVQEVSGLLAGSAGIIDGTAGVTSGGIVHPSGTIGPPSYTSSAAGEYLLYVYGDNEVGGTFTWSAPAGYTADAHGQNAAGTGKCNITAAYKNSTAGTETGTWTATGAVNDCGAAVIMAAFKLPATVPPALPVVSQYQGFF